MEIEEDAQPGRNTFYDVPIDIGTGAGTGDGDVDKNLVNKMMAIRFPTETKLIKEGGSLTVTEILGELGWDPNCKEKATFGPEVIDALSRRHILEKLQTFAQADEAIKARIAAAEGTSLDDVRSVIY